MKLPELSATVLTALTCLMPLMPAYAGTVEQETQHIERQTQTTRVSANSSNSSSETVSNTVKTSVRIPASTAIAVAFPSDLVLEANNEQTATLILAQPIFDELGNEIAPKNTFISALLKPAKGGVSIVAESLIVRGRTVPIQASSVVIRGQEVTMQSGVDHAREASQLGGRLGGTVIGAMNSENINGMKQAALAGTGVGMLFGLFSPKKATVVKIPQGSMYVLTLQSDAVIPNLRIAL